MGDFSLSASKKYAELLNKRIDFKEYKKENDLRKDKMKFDFAIVATALVNNADCIFSYDPHVKNFGNGLIEVKELPDMATQISLW